MNINLINLHILNLAALFQFVADLLRIITGIGAEKLKIKAQVDALLTPAFNKFDAAYKKERKSDFTDNIGDLDKARDKKTSAVNTIVKLNLDDNDEKKREAAKKLTKLLKIFKGITKKPIREQSAETTNLIQELTGKYAAEVELLGLKDKITEIEELNNQIIALGDERDSERKEKNRLDIEAAKKDLIAAVRAILNMTEILIMTEGVANYKDFVESVNILIAQYGGSRGAAHTPSGDDTPLQKGNEEGDEDKYPNAREWSADIDYQTCASGDIFYIIRNGVKEYYKLLDFGEVATFEPGMDDGGIWEKLS